MIFKTFADQHWIGFNFLGSRTGLRLNNFTVRSTPLSAVHRTGDARGDCLIECPPTKI